MKKILALSIFCVIRLSLSAQIEILSDKIEDSLNFGRADRQYVLQLESEQVKADYADGRKDTYLNLDEDKIRSTVISKAIFDDPRFILLYTLNNIRDHQTKRDYLTTTINLLRYLNQDLNDGKINVNYYKNLFEKAKGLIRSIQRNNYKYFIKENAGKELYALLPMLENNEPVKAEMINILADEYPVLLLPKLKTISPESLQDKIVSKTSRSEPKLILNFATSTAEERNIVRRNPDPYVQKLVELADKSQTPLKSVLFLDDYVNEKAGLGDINRYTANDKLYYKKLVDLMTRKDIPLNKQVIGKEFDHEAKIYVQKMNELHNAGDGVRFSCINDFNSQELYYVMVYGDDEFYTSSYLGTFRRFLAKMNPKNGYDFLESIDFMRFRTFIRLSANFNTVSDYMKSMQKEQRSELIKRFVNNLDRTAENNLEGAIDVATTYSSLKDTSLQELIIEEVQRNRNEASITNNTLALRIYNILNIMFTGTNEEIMQKLNIPPFTSLPIQSLESDSGVVVQQIFFPGDQDGKGVYNSFLNRHPANQWKRTNFDKWVKLESRNGKLIKFANKPLDEPEDEFAQNALQEYLDANNIRPSVIIQRGHSYHVANCIDHINNNHKIVVLGACGGFNHLETIMRKSPDAHIISSKQIGSGSVNWPILDKIDGRLINGKDVDWIEIWGELEKIFGRGNSLFDDYVPPHKNLGSLFLKAFYRAELEEAGEE